MKTYDRSATSRSQDDHKHIVKNWIPLLTTRFPWKFIRKWKLNVSRSDFAVHYYPKGTEKEIIERKGGLKDFDFSEYDTNQKPPAMANSRGHDQDSYDGKVLPRCLETF